MLILVQKPPWSNISKLLCYANQAPMNRRRRQLISLSGDGGFTMLMGDFLSLTQLWLPVKIVVLNNGALGFIELE